MRSPEPAFDLRAAMSEELRAAIGELDGAKDNPKAIHQCRVHVKRARSLSRVGRVCAPGLSSVFHDSARALMRNLALARDPAALSEAAHAAANKRSGLQKRALNAVAESLADEMCARPNLNIEAVRAGLKDLLALAQVWPEASPRQIKKGAKRIERRARKARRRGLSTHNPDQRHKWRTREKDRYYAALLLADAWPGKRKLKKGSQAGDLLGKERDTLLLMERLIFDPDIAGEPRSAGRALKALDRRRRRLHRRANRAGALMRANA